MRAIRGRIVSLFLVVVLMTLFGSVALAQGETVIATNNPTVGNILTDTQGKTLYLFLKDTPNASSACYQKCAELWPPLLISEGNPIAGAGTDGNLLGVLTRTDGARQVLYNGWPVYYYTPDATIGDAKGQGVGKVWFVISLDAAGTPGPVPAAPVAAPAAPAAPAPAAPAPAAPALAPTMHSVSVKDNSFDAKTVTVKVGDTVTWTINGQRAHNVVADNGSFTSKDLKTGETTTFAHTFTTPGTFAYYCVYHGGPGGQGMSGTIVVQAASAGSAPAQLPRTGGSEAPLALIALIALALLGSGLLITARARRQQA